VKNTWAITCVILWLVSSNCHSFLRLRIFWLQTIMVPTWSLIVSGLRR